MKEKKDNGIKDNKVLLDRLYDDRVNYTIVALTGYSGTGCSRLAHLMETPFNEWKELRKPNEIVVEEPRLLDNEDLMYQGETNHKYIGNAIFARKYAICYNYANDNYRPFKILKYSYVLMFLTLCRIIKDIEKAIGSEEKRGEVLRTHLKKVLKDKYRPSRQDKDDNYRQIRFIGNDKPEKFEYDTEGNGNYIWEQIQNMDGFEYSKWSELIKAFDTINEGKDNEAEKACLFFGLNQQTCFFDFIKQFNEYISTADPYCCNFFYHRLGFVMRAVGDPLKTANDVMHSGEIYTEHLYDVVDCINDIIKGYRKFLKREDKDGRVKPCRIVIDKIRNSLEAKFLKERYAAFYQIAIHEVNAVKEHLLEKIKRNFDREEYIRNNKALINSQVDKILSLDAIERMGSDFEKGKFFAQNISQCVGDAEIHISNEEGMGIGKAYFCSMDEQWMKYASLIQHPGLITPSSEERCMVVAYTAKFNSGCISRQVGAVITNKAHTIRSIGWNDVPYGQMPCSLRELQLMATGQNDVLRIRKYVYSDYEIGSEKRLKDGLTFNDRVKLKYSNLHVAKPEELMKGGLPYSYCFKALQNEFEEQKNQVHTRSLHAEENAILQMAKYGGEALFQGIIYVTASPCELCCKKLYQIGVRKIVYIDEYPGISRENIIANGYHRPKLKQFQGAYGQTYFKLYQPLISYKEEMAIRKGVIGKKGDYEEDNIKVIKVLLESIGGDVKEKKLTEEECKKLMRKVLEQPEEDGENKN